MAIKLDCISIITPLSRINQCNHIAGLSDLLTMYRRCLNRTVFYDDYLFKEGAMSPLDVQQILKRWEKWGLQLTEHTNNGPVWKDLCVVDALKGLYLPCQWLGLDLAKGLAWYKGKQ